MRRRSTATTLRPTASRVTTPTNKSANTTRGTPFTEPDGRDRALRQAELAAGRVSLPDVGPDLNINAANSAVDSVFRRVGRTFQHRGGVSRKDEPERWVVRLLAWKEDGDRDPSPWHRRRPPVWIRPVAPAEREVARRVGVLVPAGRQVREVSNRWRVSNHRSTLLRPEVDYESQDVDLVVAVLAPRVGTLCA